MKNAGGQTDACEFERCDEACGRCRLSRVCVCLSRWCHLGQNYVGCGRMCLVLLNVILGSRESEEKGERRSYLDPVKVDPFYTRLKHPGSRHAAIAT